MNNDLHINLAEAILADRPFEAISSSTWERLVWALEEEMTPDTTVQEIVSAVGLSWPHTRRDEKVKKYLALSLSELRSLRGFGKKKQESLFFAFQAVLNKGWKKEETQGYLFARKRKPFPSEIVLLDSIKDIQPFWDKIRFALYGEPLTHDLLIAEIAKELNLWWPDNRLNQRLKKYLGCEWNGLLKQLGKSSEKFSTYLKVSVAVVTRHELCPILEKIVEQTRSRFREVGVKKSTLTEFVWGKATGNLNEFSTLLVSDLLSKYGCLLYTSPSPRDQRGSRMPSSA